MAEAKSSKNDTPEKVTPHTVFAEEISPDFMRMYAAMEELKNTNTVSRAILIEEVSVLPGKPKMDKDGNMVLENGEPVMWDDTIYLTAASMAGTVQIRVTPEQFKGIQVGKWHMAVGKIIVKSAYNSTRVEESINYTEFQPLFGMPEAK